MFEGLCAVQVLEGAFLGRFCLYRASMTGVGLIALCMIWYSVYTIVFTFHRHLLSVFLISAEGIEKAQQGQQGNATLYERRRGSL